MLFFKRLKIIDTVDLLTSSYLLVFLEFNTYLIMLFLQFFQIIIFIPEFWFVLF